jgi:TonB family protein
VSLWLSPDGSVNDVLLDGSTGDLELDNELLAALGNLDAIAQSPPRGLPQPVQLRIVSRL